jgi:MFS transporter, PAT family, beta-lactamase induction signal transducer AmpG
MALASVEQSLDRESAPFWFGILAIAAGVYSAVPATLLGFLLRGQGVPVERIAGVVALGSLPFTWSFALAPFVDLGRRRRSWVIGGYLLAALCLWPVVAWTMASLALRTGLLLAAGACTCLGTAGLQALMTEFPPLVRGRVGGWWQAGNVGGGAMGGGLMLWFAQSLGGAALATAVCAVFLLPIFAIFAVHEHSHVASAVPIFARFSSLFAGLREFLKSPRTWAGLLFFIGPMGTSGAVFSALAADFHASANEVMWVTGVGAGLIAVPGSLLGGWIADRLGKAWANILSGVLLASCAGLMAAARFSPVTFAVGVLAYQFFIGFGYATYTALLLDVIAGRREGAATGYCALNSVGNVPVVYMTALAGVAYKQIGPRGPMAFDALANILGAILLSGLLLWAARRKNRWDLTTVPAPVLDR